MPFELNHRLMVFYRRGGGGTFLSLLLPVIQYYSPIARIVMMR
jgi:hypothetical protein